MLASRALFVVLTLAAWLLNGGALMQHLSIATVIDGLIPATLIVNMIAAPLLLWAAYKSGELAEEAYRDRLRGETALAGAAAHERAAGAATVGGETGSQGRGAHSERSSHPS